MKNLTFAKYPLAFLVCLLLGNQSLNAQNEGLILTDFKAFSFINSNQIFDSLDYNPEVPVGGPVQFLEDSLVIFAPDGSFQLNYTPVNEKAFVAIWVDTNDDGLFEAEEVIYEGEANEGSLADTLNLPIFSGSRPALVAISNDQKNLLDPREIPGNPEISSLRFIMQFTPPKLTMTSKKGNNEITVGLPQYCDTLITFEINNPSSSCFIVSSWTITYPISNTLAISPSSITESPSGVPFGVGQQKIDEFSTIDLALDVFGLPLMNNDLVTFTLHYTELTDTTQVYSESFQFIYCTSNNIRDLRNEFESTTNLKVNPNPIRGSAMIEFDLLKPVEIQLSLSDISGRLIEQIYEGSGVPGHRQLSYTPPKLAKGLYILSLQSKYGTISKKIVITNH